MSIDIPVKVGDKIPLSAQETTGATDKVVRATIYDMSDFTLLGGPVTLTHQSNGAYINNAVNMPDIERVYAQYTIFESNGTTPNLTGDQVVFDVFLRDTLVQDIVGSVGSATRPPDVVASVEEDGLKAILEEDRMVTATVEEGDFVATVTEDGEETATTEDGDFNANLEC